MSRIIAGPAAAAGWPCRPGTRPDRPPTGSARRCSPRSRPGPAGRRRGAEQALDGLSFADLYAGSGAVGPGGGQPGRRPRCCWWRRPADGAARGPQRRGTRAAGPDRRPARSSGGRAQPADASYDVIFADPPYELGTTAVEHVVTDLLDNGWLARGGPGGRGAVEPVGAALLAPVALRRAGSVRTARPCCTSRSDSVGHQRERAKGGASMDYKLEVIGIPVSDVDQSPRRSTARWSASWSTTSRPAAGHARGAADPARIGVLDRHR